MSDPNGVVGQTAYATPELLAEQVAQLLVAPLEAASVVLSAAV